MIENPVTTSRLDDDWRLRLAAFNRLAELRRLTSPTSP
jgi:hypothetical protein